MSKAKSIQQYRELFSLYEPEILSFLDDYINVFSREQIKNLRVYCPCAF